MKRRNLVKGPLSKLPILLSLMLANTLVGAADVGGNLRQGIGGALFSSKDNEDFFTQRTAVEYLPRFTHGDALTGVRVTSHRFEQNNWSRNGQQLTLMHRDIDPATANGWQLESGLFRQGEHRLLTLDGNYRAPLAKDTAVEFFINRDWVETAEGLNQGIHFTYAGGSLEQGIGSHVTLVGLLGHQRFSDDNYRNHGRVRLIVQPNLDLGLTLQARYRVYTSKSEDVGGAYFNPKQYDESLLMVGWRQRISGWMAHLTAGAGRQRVADDPSTPARLLEINLHSPPHRSYSFRMRGGVNQSASFNGPNYRYNYILGEWILGF